LDLSSQEIDLINRIIPMTVNLKKTPYFLSEILQEKDGWISKPSDSSLGLGIVFGANLSDSAWSKLVKDRSQDGYVFQKRVPFNKGSILKLSSLGDIDDVDIEFDFCPYFINGKPTETALVRAREIQSVNNSRIAFQTTNVSAGATIVPCVQY
jgi:hypothetical protein